MTEHRSARRFARIDRLPPYVFNITAELKMAARRRGEDIIDLSMGNPDGATPAHIVEKLCTVAQREDTHGYSTPRGIPRLRRASSAGELSKLVRSGAPLDLIALRGLMTLPIDVVAAQHPDPAGAWRRGDPEVVRRLAELQLQRFGVALRR